MSWDFLFFLNSILLGIGLAMDAFSVSIVNGLNEPGMRMRKGIWMAGAYAFFQFLMPMVGWTCVHLIADQFVMFERMVPWIALLLLLYIGGKMLWEGIRENCKSDEVKEICLAAEEKKLTVSVLLIQGLATSIDALSVGFTIENYPPVMAFVAAIIIAVVTFIICLGGLKVGKFVGMHLLGKASVFGGLILIGIGIEIFLKGILG